MAWEGDSYIAEGIYKSIDLAQSLGADLVFLSDGQESPPLAYSGPPAFEGKPGQVRGLLVGVGDYGLSPIPKFDDYGFETGFLREEDVTQESRFGLPPPGADKRPGYNPRNAPFGAAAARGNEHLSSVREQYLQSMARKTGLGYAHLTTANALLAAIESRATPRYVPVVIDLTPWLAAAGCAALSALYLLSAYARASPKLHATAALFAGVVRRRLSRIR
jgi:mxaL protein